MTNDSAVIANQQEAVYVSFEHKGLLVVLGFWQQEYRVGILTKLRGRAVYFQYVMNNVVVS